MAKKPVSKSKKTAKKTSKPAPKKVVAASTKSQTVMTPKIGTPTEPKNRATKSYTMSEFVENIRGFCGLPKRSQAKELVDDIAKFIRESLRRGYKLPLLGLGKLYVRESKARQGRNPQTGEVVQIPARKRVRFSAAKALKEAVLR